MVICYADVAGVADAVAPSSVSVRSVYTSKHRAVFFLPVSYSTDLLKEGENSKRGKQPSAGAPERKRVGRDR